MLSNWAVRSMDGHGVPELLDQLAKVVPGLDRAALELWAALKLSVYVTLLRRAGRPVGDDLLAVCAPLR